MNNKMVLKIKMQHTCTTHWNAQNGRKLHKNLKTFVGASGEQIAVTHGLAPMDPRGKPSGNTQGFKLNTMPFQTNVVKHAWKR